MSAMISIHFIVHTILSVHSSAPPLPFRIMNTQCFRETNSQTSLLTLSIPLQCLIRYHTWKICQVKLEHLKDEGPILRITKKMPDGKAFPQLWNYYSLEFILSVRDLYISTANAIEIKLHRSKTLVIAFSNDHTLKAFREELDVLGKGGINVENENKKTAKDAEVEDAPKPNTQPPKYVNNLNNDFATSLVISVADTNLRLPALSANSKRSDPDPVDDTIKSYMPPMSPQSHTPLKDIFSNDATCSTDTNTSETVDKTTDEVHLNRQISSSIGSFLESTKAAQKNAMTLHAFSASKVANDKATQTDDVAIVNPVDLKPQEGTGVVVTEGCDVTTARAAVVTLSPNLLELEIDERKEADTTTPVVRPSPSRGRRGGNDKRRSLTPDGSTESSMCLIPGCHHRSVKGMHCMCKKHFTTFYSSSNHLSSTGELGGGQVGFDKMKGRRGSYVSNPSASEKLKSYERIASKSPRANNLA
jgi:hypothetical protein